MGLNQFIRLRPKLNIPISTANRLYNSGKVIVVIKHGYENSTMITEASSKKGLFLAIMYILCSASLKTFMDGKLSALD